MKCIFLAINSNFAGVRLVLLSLAFVFGLMSRQVCAHNVSNAPGDIGNLTPATLRELLQIQQDPNVYRNASNNFNDPDWYNFWSSNGLSATALTDGSLDAPRYYIRVNPDVTDQNYTNFDNVQRVMRIMPQENFERLFKNTTNFANPINTTDLTGSLYYFNNPKGLMDATLKDSTVVWHGADTNGIPQTYRGQIYSYANFLKAVAYLPGFCGDYTAYPTTDTNLQAFLTSHADLIARKMLATFFAHAVQETSNSGTDSVPLYTTNRFMDKIPGTFASVVEGVGEVELPATAGIFAPGGVLYNLTLTGEKFNKTTLKVTPWDSKEVSLNLIAHNYAGRGPKQLSYPNSYANFSALFFGDLRAVAWPELLETSSGELSVSAYLSAIAYSLIPFSSKPSIAEIMDGTLRRKLDALAPAIPKSETNAFNAFRMDYDYEFPATTFIVNGAVEGGKSLGNEKNAANWQVRADAYNYFVTTTNLLNNVYVGTNLALAPTSETSNAYYDLRGSHTNDAATNWTSDAFTAAIFAPGQPWRSLFQRDIYYGRDWQATNVVLPYDVGLQIFGGSEIKCLMDLVNKTPK